MQPMFLLKSKFKWEILKRKKLVPRGLLADTSIMLNFHDFAMKKEGGQHSLCCTPRQFISVIVLYFNRYFKKSVHEDNDMSGKKVIMFIVVILFIDN